MDESSSNRPDGNADPVETPENSVHYRVMTVDSVLYELGEISPHVHLMEDEEPYRYLTIPVSLSDGISLHNALNGVVGRRPSTHELFTHVLGRLQVDVIAVRIVRFESGVFYSELELMTARGREIFDCRTSDALTLAYRQIVPAPVLCTEAILEDLNES